MYVGEGSMPICLETPVPRFSVCVSSYLDAEYLPACIESVLSQTYSDLELVIVDDASPDSTAELISRYAHNDARVVPIIKEVNEGVHLGRKSAVAAASGDYVIFLDSDDELAPEFLEELNSRMGDDSADIIHFGIKVVNAGVDQHERDTFEAYVNRPIEDLEGLDICKAAYSKAVGFRQDWRVTQRAYSLGLAKAAFEQMTSDRMGRAQDCYETFVLLALGKRQITVNGADGLLYYLGRGVNSASRLTPEMFLKSANGFWGAVECVEAFVDLHPELDFGDCLFSTKRKMLELLFNDWVVRVERADKIPAARIAASVLGGANVATELMRLVRDDAYAKWVSGDGFSEQDEFYSWYVAAKEIAGNEGCESPDYQEMHRTAKGHIDDLRKRAFRESAEAQDIRIFVSTHKRVHLFDSKILQPVQVGACMRDVRFSWTLQDDEGENFSSQNPMYCELTTQYWAWKNVDAPYIGFCHYRRYFDFSDVVHKQNIYGEVIDSRIDSLTQKKYCLDDASIARAVEGFDVITTPVNDIASYTPARTTMRGQYDLADRLYVEDLDKVVDILVRRHPEYETDAKSFLSGHKARFCNMFIMKREIFRDYCAWLFPILEEFVSTTDMSAYSREGVRTPGHLSERLLNIYLLHHERVGTGWKTKELQCVHFEQPDYPYAPKMLMSDSDYRPVIPVVLASDNNYVPMLTTTVYSMLQNASKDYRYDIVVLHRDISGENQGEMSRFFAQFAGVTLRFCDVSEIIADYNLSTNNPHISVETYYRFLIQKLLPFYDKVLYLDSDLVVNGDVSELFSTYLGDNLLAAVRDIDFAGNVNMKNGKRLDYAKNVLGMRQPFDYFQAGVLLLNTRAMRDLHPIEKWLELASDDRYIYNDQDVLNACCEGRVTFLAYDWNVMIDCGNRINNVFAYAPAPMLDAFMDSRCHEKIVHYAGFEKPWKMSSCDRSELYWSYARDTPFYEKLVANMAACLSQAAPGEYRPRPRPSISPDNTIVRGIFDPILPLGSKRREAAKSFLRAVRGLN